MGNLTFKFINFAIKQAIFNYNIYYLLLSILLLIIISILIILMIIFYFFKFKKINILKIIVKNFNKFLYFIKSSSKKIYQKIKNLINFKNKKDNEPYIFSNNEQFETEYFLENEFKEEGIELITKSEYIIEDFKNLITPILSENLQNIVEDINKDMDKKDIQKIKYYNISTEENTDLIYTKLKLKNSVIEKSTNNVLDYSEYDPIKIKFKNDEDSIFIID